METEMDEEIGRGRGGSYGDKEMREGRRGGGKRGGGGGGRWTREREVEK